MRTTTMTASVNRDRNHARKRATLPFWRVYTRLTAPIRVLPDFIIIGAQKGGTTSLYRYLAQHPLVRPALKKEIKYFDCNYHRGRYWYRSHFPSQLSYGQEAVTGEASPYYIFNPLAPKRMAKLIPQVKLIALLRNPVDRAYSHYMGNVRKGHETLSFREAIAKEAERLAGAEEKIHAGDNQALFKHIVYSYLARGIYVDQLKVWSDLFPAEQLLILKSEDFFTDVEATYLQVLSFLGLPPYPLKAYPKHRRGRYAGMDPEMRQQLHDYFKPHNDRLAVYLGRDMNWVDTA